MRNLAWIISTLVVTLVAPAGRAGEEGVHTLHSERLNGTYEDLGAEIAPVSLGLLTIRLTSPTHRLEVLRNRLELHPHGDGTHQALLNTQIRGEAHLVASLDFGGLPGEVEDQIVLPLQEARLAARVEIERVADGYLVTPVELPPYLELTVESRLGGRLVSLCEGFSFLALGGLACAGLEHALSTLRLPLPPPGETYFIAEDELTQGELRQIEAYLSGL